VEQFILVMKLIQKSGRTKVGRGIFEISKQATENHNLGMPIAMSEGKKLKFLGFVFLNQFQLNSF
jgi:hypothetical protein